MNDSREALRLRLRAERELVGNLAQKTAAEAIAERIRIAVTDRLGSAALGTVAGYFPVAGEIDPGIALDRLRERGWSVVQPICGENASMEFCLLYTSDAADE